jgi:hypothetical protein
VDGTCKLCGRYGALTDEHVPPRAAFNDATVLFHYLEQVEGALRQAVREAKGGLSHPVLCGPCNSHRTGSRYGTEYAAFIKAVAAAADQATEGDIISISLRTFPLRVVKQALTGIVSTSQESVVEDTPALRYFILTRDRQGMPEGLRLYGFVPATRGIGRSTGRAVLIDRARPTGLRLAESTWWPIGWILTFDGGTLSAREAFDFTSWGNVPFDRRQNVQLSLPVHWIFGYGAADFRSRAQLERENTPVFFGDIR